MWFQELHAALPEGHRETLQSLYLVHPRSHRISTRAWLFMLQGQDAGFYGKARPHDSSRACLAMLLGTCCGLAESLLPGRRWSGGCFKAQPLVYEPAASDGDLF